MSDPLNAPVKMRTSSIAPAKFNDPITGATVGKVKAPVLVPNVYVTVGVIPGEVPPS